MPDCAGGPVWWWQINLFVASWLTVKTAESGEEERKVLNRCRVCVVGDDIVMNPFSAPLHRASLTETIIIIISTRYEALGGDSSEGLQIRMMNQSPAILN